jgi:hypothetical protein
LGWSWLFPPYYWHFNAIAEEPTETVFFYGSRLLQECDRNHDFGYELFKRMSQILISRLQATREKWIEAGPIFPAAPGPAAGLSDYLRPSPVPERRAYCERVRQVPDFGHHVVFQQNLHHVKPNLYGRVF